MMTTITTTTPTQIKLPFTFDVAKMQAELTKIATADFIYYNVINLRSPAHFVDPARPIPPPAEDYADGSWTDWLNTPPLEQAPCLTSIVDYFREHTAVTLVRLLRLAPHSEVKEHTDPTLGLHIHKSVIRLTIPIIANEQVQFFLANEIVPLQPGECWYLDLTQPHKIINAGATERVNLTIDMVPNDWVREQIELAKDH